VYDGQFLKCRVNGGTWEAVEAPVVSLWIPYALAVHHGGGPAAHFDLAQRLTFDTVLTEAQLDGLYAEARLNYAVP
jgi:hypothetical protein